MLSRAARREREFAIRSAIGASRSTVARQWLIESVLLSLIGGVAGVFLAWYGTDALARMTAVNLPRLSEVHLDFRALAVSIVISLLIGLVFGAAPAFFSGRADLTQALKEGGRGMIGRGRRPIRPALAIVEVALALMLLVGAGLLIRSFLRVRATDPGFRTENVLAMNLSLPPAMYASPADVRSFIERLDAKLRAIPGVMAVGAGNGLPLERSQWRRLFSMEDETMLRGKRPPAAFTVISGDYFQALGIALKRGRLFTSADGNEKTPVLIVSETMARSLWPGQDPIGKLIKFGPPQSKIPFHTVIGVAADVKEDSLEHESVFRSYVPSAQVGDAIVDALNTPGIVVRSSQAAESVAAAVRAAVRSLDSQMPVEKLQTMEQRLDGTLSARRVQMYVVALFASAALLLSALGVYGVIAYSVTERTQEIGIRMALGATQSGVLRMVVRQGVLMTGIGIAAGFAGSAALTRTIKSLLYGVQPTDAATYALVAAVLLAAAVVASLLPARRAMSVDPMVALRRE
jgi:putative ABC transport system permease protein